MDQVGVGPHPWPWPHDPRLDPELLESGDRRNVADRYRYWTVEAIVADLDARRHPFHVAVENWQHDMNIGSVVRTANAFLAREVHIVGRRRWNRRGAMVTERYQHVRHHAALEDLAAWAAERSLPVLGVDNLPGSVPLETYPLPAACVLLLGQEGPGLSEPARGVCKDVLSITQFGSTRSLNAGAAAAIAMHTWVLRHASGGPPTVGAQNGRVTITPGQDLLGGPPPTRLPDDDDARAALDAGTDPREVAAAHPTYALAWARLAERARAEGDPVAAYAYARAGYHRSLDLLRRHGWKGHGPVPWDHTGNEGFLRSLNELGAAAAAIGEDEEAERCVAFLRDSSAAAADELLGG